MSFVKVPVDYRPEKTHSAWQKQLESAAAGWEYPKQIAKQGLKDGWREKKKVPAVV